MAYHATLHTTPTNTSYALEGARPRTAVLDTVAITLETISHWLSPRPPMPSISRLSDHTLRDIGVHRTGVSPAPCAPATPIRSTSSRYE